MKRAPLFIELSSRFYELEPSYSIDHTKDLSHIYIWTQLSLFFGLIELNLSKKYLIERK